MGRFSLVPGVTKQIVGLILEGRLRPGDHINQNQLAMELGVSPTPLREALHTLAGEGIVRFSKSAGVQVSPLTTDGIIENTELALALETAALRRALPLLTAEDLDELERTLDRISQLQDTRDWYPLTWSFYHRLLAPSGFESFLELIRKSIFQAMLVLPLFAKVRPTVLAAEPNLRTVIAACRRRDLDGAIRALEEFNRKACQATVRLIQTRLETEKDLPVISK
jgi:DNA-binding GntR family transcriptional regulator